MLGYFKILKSQAIPKIIKGKKHFRRKFKGHFYGVCRKSKLSSRYFKNN